MIRTLLIILLAVAMFGAGFYTQRYLRCTIEVHLTVVCRAPSIET